MFLREKLIYICFLALLILGCIFYFSPKDEKYVDIYNTKIEVLQCRIDSLNNVNIELIYKIDTLNFKISGLDDRLQQKTLQINRLRNEIISQVSIVNDFTNNQLQEFFTNHYNSPRDTIR